MPKIRNLLSVNELRVLKFVKFIVMNKKFSLFAAACLIFAAQALAEDPRIKQGAIFESQGNYEMALGEYRSMLAEDPNNSVAYMAAANVRMKMKDYSGALANYRLAYKFNPTLSAAYEGAAKVFELLGDKKKAEAELAKDPKNKPVTEEAAPVTEPVKVAEPVKAAEPAKPAAPAKVVEPVKAEASKPAAPAKAVEPAKTAEPVKTAAPTKSVESANVLPADPFEKGKALFAAGKYNEAAPLWREVLKKTPGHAGAYFYAGLTRFELGEYDKAEFNLKRGLEYKGEGNDANYFLACIYQKSKKVDLEKKFLNNYLKKAAPNGKYRKNAEDRLASLNAAKAEEQRNSSAVESSSSQENVKAQPAVEKVAAPEEKAPQAEAQASVAETVPAEVKPSVALAVEMYRAGNLEGAMQTYKSLLDTELSPEERYFSLLQMGNIYREMRDFHSAVTRYREVVLQFPDSDWATEAERALEDAVWLEKHSSELPRKK